MAVLSRASAVSLTTKVTADLYTKKLSVSEEKIRVIPPVLNQERLGEDEEPEKLFFDDKIVLAYIGSFYPGVREPHSLLSLVREIVERRKGLVESLEVHIYGETRTVRETFDEFMVLGNMLHLHGPTSHDVVKQVLEQADVLVNIGNNTAYQLPSKLVEYISTGKPLINIYSVVRCAREIDS